MCGATYDAHMRRTVRRCASNLCPTSAGHATTNGARMPPSLLSQALIVFLNDLRDRLALALIRPCHSLALHPKGVLQRIIHLVNDLEGKLEVVPLLDSLSRAAPKGSDAAQAPPGIASAPCLVH